MVTNIIDIIINALIMLHGFYSEKGNIEDLQFEYYTKTMQRLDKVRTAIPFSDNSIIIINGKKCRNILLCPEILSTEIAENLFDTVFCPIHGDCTFTNTLVDCEGKIRFIDARGYFGRKEIAGDVRYDWVKLFYSIYGNFDQFNAGNFDLAIRENEIKYTIGSNGFEHLTDYFTSKIPNFNIRAIKLIHSIVWLSMASHAWVDFDSLCLAFYNGLWYFEDYMESK
jgi:hypothetical protein